MATKYTSVRVTEETYELLKRRKRDDESFSDAIHRLAGERSLLELAGILSDEEGDEIEAALDERYEEYSHSLEDTWSE